MLKRGILLTSLIVVLILSGCDLLGDKPVVSGLGTLTLKATEGVPYIFEIENPKSKFGSNTFSNFNIELGDNELVRLNYAAFTPDSIADTEKATVTMHLTGLELGSGKLSFIIYYDEGEKRKSMTLKVATKVIGPGITVALEERPAFGKIRLKINETKVFHAVITNSIDTRYRNGRLRIKPLYDWVQLKEIEGYDSYMDGNSLVIATDIPTAKTIPFMVNAVPPAIEAGFSIDVMVEYSSNTTEWTEVAKQTVEMFAEG